MIACLDEFSFWSRNLNIVWIRPFISWSDQGIAPKQFSKIKFTIIQTSPLIMNRHCIRKTKAWLLAFRRAGSPDLFESIYLSSSSFFLRGGFLFFHLSLYSILILSINILNYSNYSKNHPNSRVGVFLGSFSLQELHFSCSILKLLSQLSFYFQAKHYFT